MCAFVPKVKEYYANSSKGNINYQISKKAFEKVSLLKN
jgi:hypothetical protein